MSIVFPTLYFCVFLCYTICIKLYKKGMVTLHDSRNIRLNSHQLSGIT